MVMLGMMGVPYLQYFPRFWKFSGIMVKIRDEISGEIYHGTSFSKPVTDADKKKLAKGVDIIRRVFMKAGADSDSVIVLKPSGAHPSASCRIGEVVGQNLQTEIDNLFCCDASVFPEALGLPVIWTLTSLGKRLSSHLDLQLKQADPACIRQRTFISTQLPDLISVFLVLMKVSRISVLLKITR
jgi:choline dehydrogenase-like flavoprotein